MSDDTLLNRIAEGQTFTATAGVAGEPLAVLIARVRRPEFRARLAERRAEQLTVNLRLLADAAAACGRHRADPADAIAMIGYVEASLRFHSAYAAGVRLMAFEAAITDAG